MSAEIVSLTGGTGSSSDRGGNSESDISANNGCCFSRSTRSLLTTVKGARIIGTGGSSSILTRSSSTISSRSSAACSPMRRSSSDSRRSRIRIKLNSKNRPTCSARVNQENLKNKDMPMAKTTNKTKVAPVNPIAICNGSPSNSPKTPPGGLGKSMVMLCMRIDSKAMLETMVKAKPKNLGKKGSGSSSLPGNLAAVSSCQPLKARLSSRITHQ